MALRQGCARVFRERRGGGWGRRCREGSGGNARGPWGHCGDTGFEIGAWGLRPEEGHTSHTVANHCGLRLLGTNCKGPGGKRHRMGKDCRCPGERQERLTPESRPGWLAGQTWGQRGGGTQGAETETALTAWAWAEAAACQVGGRGRAGRARRGWPRGPLLCGAGGGQALGPRRSTASSWQPSSGQAKRT